MLKFTSAILALLATTAANAQSQSFTYEEANQGFKTPSGNIVCMSGVTMQNGKEDIPSIDCRIGKVDHWTMTSPSCTPAKWDKFNVFTIEHRAKQARLDCIESNYAEIVREQQQFGLFKNGLRVLNYGDTWRLGGVSCTSEMSGLTCRNTEGHGFSLSRKSQSVF